MKNTQTFETRTKKECRECGCVIKERRESIIYECERCIANAEE
ncbi:YhfH family protein [Planococcus donghaensis]|nr:YhfH family protein [Planococcus donghaensis]